MSGRACARQARPHSLTASLQTTSGALLGFGLGCRCRRRFRSRRGRRFRRRRRRRFRSRHGRRFSRRRRRRFSRWRRGRFRSRRSRRRHRLALAAADDHHGRQQTHTQTSQPPLTHSHRRTLHRGSRVVFACRPARRRPPCPRGPRGPARTERAGLLYHSLAVSTDFSAANGHPAGHVPYRGTCHARSCVAGCFRTRLTR